MANKAARQKKLGPAPFASFEDLSEDLSSPESKGYQPMPEICEEHQRGAGDDASASTSTAQTPTTPRIDVEQASSPSQAESGDSTPERELFDMDMAAGHLTSAFLEGAADVDLRSSAEDMAIPYSSGSFKGRHSRKSSLLARSAPGARKISWDGGDGRDGQQPTVEHQPLERKGSSGRKHGDTFSFSCRDTRLSSISSNVSATSGMSALSAFSVRRSPSPHRMQLETSFCGPKTVAAAAAKEAEEEEELVELEASRRPSLLNPYTWFGEGANSRSASPIGTPSSPNCSRAFMFKYATEPRSRPTSPMGWHSAAPSPAPSWAGEATAAATALSSKWLASPRCHQRRASSPHRTLVETSFCGHMQIKVPDDEVEPRGPSPMPSLGSLLSINHPVKYATEPRSRPASPTSSRSFLSLTPVPADSARRGSVGRCASPMIETSFCGPKQLVRGDSQEVEAAAVRLTVKPSPLITAPKVEAPAGLKAVRYTTEPRSRPVSPQPPSLSTSLVTQQHPTTAMMDSISRTDSPVISRATRSPSPHMMRVETSFCGGKQPPPPHQDSIPGQREYQEDDNVTHVSIHPLPVKYATEPRSRPVSPCNFLTHHCPTPDAERRRSPSPHRMVVETSFYSSKLPVENESIDLSSNWQNKVVDNVAGHRQEMQSPNTTPVKYATEPRSRPVSPNVHLLSNHSTPGTERRHRSPSPHRMQVETSFCGTRQQQVAKQESQTESAGQLIANEMRPVEQATDTISNSSESVSDLPTPRNHFEDDGTTQNSSSRSSLVATTVEDKEDERNEFLTHWPDQSVSQFASSWPVQHLSTFEMTDKKLSQGDLRSSSEETASPPSQHSNGHIAPATKMTSIASPSRPGRQMPKPVACPKPPQSFTPQYDSSAPSSPLPSPALSRRMESASPSPSSPFPSRRTSLGRFGIAGVEEPSPDQLERKSSVTTTKSGDLYDDLPAPQQSPADKPDKGHKSRSVLSVLFGKKSGKNKNKDQELVAVEEKDDSHRNGQQETGGNRMLSLPIASRDPSPGRSAGDSGHSGDDLDDGGSEGFRHQMLEAGNESGDNMIESDLEVGKVQLPKEEVGLFHQDSMEEELPFVPTTLPIERPIAPLITPVRMRVSEVQTTPTQRPRCSISFVPRSIGDYVKIARADSVTAPDPSGAPYGQIPKIKVSLPKPDREESLDDPAAPVVPPIKVTSGVVCSNWESFAEQVLTRSHSRKRTKQQDDPAEGEEPAATTAGASSIKEVPSSGSQKSTTTQWINVEELPEPVKEAKVIKVVSKVGQKDPTEGNQLTNDGDELAADDEGEKINLVLPVRKDSVSSETALLREVEETELEEDRSPPPQFDEDEASASIQERHSQSSSLADLDSNMDDVEAAVLARSNLLVVAPFGMDLDVHSNRNSIITPSEVPSPDELSISMTQ